MLALLGVVTLVVRYKGQGGRLVQTIRRDGGVHYLSLIGQSCRPALTPRVTDSSRPWSKAIRMTLAIVRTPTIVAVCRKFTGSRVEY